MLNDPLANALSKIFNLEKVTKKECSIYPVSKVIKQVLDVMREEGYVGSYEEIDHKQKGNELQVNLLGKINKCGAIKPRYAIQTTDFEKFEKRYLPAKNFGIIILSTPKGIMTHIKAQKQKLGGRLLAYCY